MAVSAMDGYAVRSADAGTVPVTLRQIGTVPAGSIFAGRVGAGEAGRIFTGGPLPEGADAVVIQEDTQADGDRIKVREAARPDRHVRGAGRDFREAVVGLDRKRAETGRRAYGRVDQ